MLHQCIQDDPHILKEQYLPIEHYGLIGDLHTAALISKDGSIDWMCFPRFDSPSIFGALLDSGKGGFFRVAPSQHLEMNSSQHYLPDTNILLTCFFTPNSSAELIDFMPIEQIGTINHRPSIMRMIQMTKGCMEFEMTCRPAFNYAQDAHTTSQSRSGVVFHSETLSLSLLSSVSLEVDEYRGVRTTFTLQEGQTAYFVLEQVEKDANKPGEQTYDQCHHAFLHTTQYWHNWLSQSQYTGCWSEMVHRSALALKLLTYAPTGAIVAAPTTSLPERIGGMRNWDYRYTWLRDASFTLHSLLTLGFTEETEAFFVWLEARCLDLEVGGALQPLYTIDGGRDIAEVSLPHLEGYAQSTPVRIGNEAYKQQQLDIYGELLELIYMFSHYKKISPSLWECVCHLINWLSDHCEETDDGIWEVRGGSRYFVHSRLMIWVAFDRALHIACEQGLPAPCTQWKLMRAQLSHEIMERGWNEQTGSFVQYYGSDAVDASVLQMVFTDFISPTDPRMVSTIDRICSELMVNGHVYRYDPALAADDGLNGDEGTFSLCSFWLAEALISAGRMDEAHQIVENMLSYANHVGLYAEEIGPTGEALGNFPQAFSHLALIKACYRLNQALANGSTRTMTLPIEQEIAC